MNNRTIKAAIMKLSLTGFASDEDRETYNEMQKSLHWSMNGGVDLTPIYNEEGRLLKIIIDDRQNKKEEHA